MYKGIKKCEVTIFFYLKSFVLFFKNHKVGIPPKNLVEEAMKYCKKGSKTQVGKPFQLDAESCAKLDYHCFMGKQLLEMLIAGVQETHWGVYTSALASRPY